MAGCHHHAVGKFVLHNVVHYQGGGNGAVDKVAYNAFSRQHLTGPFYGFFRQKAAVIANDHAAVVFAFALTGGFVLGTIKL